MRFNPDAFLLIKDIEDGTFHDDSSGSMGAPLSGDRVSSEDVVSSTHLDGDTGMVTGGGSFADSRTEGVFDTSDGHQGQVARKAFTRSVVGGLEIGTSEGPALKVPIAECDGSQHLVRV